MFEALVSTMAIFAVFGMPTMLIGQHLRQRHRERMRAIEANDKSNHQLAALEAARSDLEARVRTLETIATDGDRDLEARLRRLSDAAAPALSEDGGRRLLERQPR